MKPSQQFKFERKLAILAFFLSFFMGSTGCTKNKTQPLEAFNKAPTFISEIAQSVAMLHDDVVNRPDDIRSKLVSATQAKNGNWWFSYAVVTNGSYPPDSDISIEIDPITQKLRVTNMAFSLHSPGATIDTNSSYEFVSLEELKSIWTKQHNPKG